MKKYVSLKDIATSLNLSVSTVSRALRDSYSISDTVKKRVCEEARRLGYKPNLIAQGLIANATRIIGVIVPDYMTYFYSSTIHSIESYARSKGYRVIITSSCESYDREVEAINNMMCLRVQGIIMCLSQETDDYTHLKELQATGMPVVFFDRVPEGEEFYTVEMDDREATRQLTEYLIGEGKKRVALVSGPSYLNVCREREGGYREVLNRHGMEPSIIYTCFGDYDIRVAADSVIDAQERYDAVICMNDTTLYGLLIRMHERKIDVPKDLWVSGFIDRLHAQIIYPHIPFVDQPTGEIGEVAVRKLLAIIDDEQRIKRRDVCKSSLCVNLGDERN